MHEVAEGATESMTRIRSITTTNEVLIATACALLTTGAAAANLPPRETTTSPVSISVTAQTDCVVNPEAGNWVKFQSLAKQWRQERGVSSSITEEAMLLPYQNIIGMGPDAVPLIIGELKSESDDPDQWFWALMAITGANPVRPEDQGDFVAMAKTWLGWAKDKGYAW